MVKKKDMAKKTLEEMNVLDDFLFHEMASRDEKGVKFCRILLETILDRPLRNVKVLSQRKVQGRGIGEHGIVIDAYIEEIPDQNESDAEVDANIYDIEPNKYKEGSEPRRGRYYHALMDTKLLKAGGEYKDMKNVTIIMILPYDPYGKDRMVYTISNQCEEDRTVEYDDGLKTIYLYTKGKVGKASQKLRDMLKYIEESTRENAVNDDLKNIHQLVMEIKHDEEVELSYMKIWELEARMRREARAEGLEEGRQEGIEQGRQEGIEQGRQEGIEEGIKEGIKEGIQQGVRILAKTYREMGIPQEEIIPKIAEEYVISNDEVREYLSEKQETL